MQMFEFLTDTKYDEAKRIMQNPPVTDRRIKQSGCMRQACPGKENCNNPRKGGKPFCWSCLLRIFGYTIKSGGVSVSVEIFIQQCRIVHGEVFDYSRVMFKTVTEKIWIGCPTHNDFFQQEARAHRQGNGCNQCSKAYQKNTEKFIAEAQKIHGDTYKYDLVVYIAGTINVMIGCKIADHGYFEQAPHSHLQGRGCNVCGRARTTAASTKDLAHFLQKARKRQGDYYDYSKVDYKLCDKNVIIICKTCNTEFEQTPDNHYGGKGCSRCKMSRLERDIDITLSYQRIIASICVKFEGLIGTKKQLSYDRAIPHANLLIEADGIQHMKASDWSGGRPGYEKQLRHDNLKDEWVIKNGLILLRISYKDVKRLADIVVAAIDYAENNPVEEGANGYIIATDFYKTFTDRDTREYIYGWYAHI